MASEFGPLGDDWPLTLTPRQLAEYLGVPVVDVYGALERKLLPGIRVKKGWRIPRSYLLEWMRSQLTQALKLGAGQESLRTDMPSEEMLENPIGDVTRTDEAVRGTVQRFDHSKGYGFITLVDGRRGFFRQDALRGTPDIGIGIGDIVTVVLGPTPVEADRYPSAKKIEVLKSSQRTQGDNAEALYYTALDVREQGNFEKAREHFEKAIDEDAFLSIYQAYATMEEDLDRLEEAERILHNALQAFPLIGALHLQLAKVTEMQKGVSEALEICRIGVQTVPMYLPLWQQLIALLLRPGANKDLGEAVRQAERAAELGLRIYEVPRIGTVLGFLRDSDLTRQAAQFFEEAGFAVEIISLTSAYASFAIEAERHEYIDGFALSGRILVRVFDRDIGWPDLRSYRRDVEGNVEGVRSLNLDMAFAVVRDDAPFRKALLRTLSENRVAIVPITVDMIQESLDGDAMEGMWRALDEWLSRRDLYATGFPVSGNLFFGRESELAEIGQTLHYGQHIGIFGLRRVGKTSLLYQLREKRSHDLVAYVDLLGIPGDSQICNYLYWAIARELKLQFQSVYPIQASRLKLTLGDTAAYQSIHSKSKIPSHFDRDLHLILDRLRRLDQEVQIIIALDEVERMLPVGDHPGFEGFAEFFAYIRGMSQTTEGKVVSLVTAANPALSEEPVWAGRDNPVFGFYREIYLPPLRREECDLMITELGRRMGISYASGALADLYHETGGHPSIVRRLCSYIQRREPWQERSLLITEEVVSRHLHDFLRDESWMFEEILSRLDRHFPLEKDLLLFIADGVASEDELIDMVDIPISTALRHLVGYQLIVREGDTYKIKLNLLDRWLKRYQLGTS